MDKSNPKPGDIIFWDWGYATGSACEVISNDGLLLCRQKKVHPDDYREITDARTGEPVECLIRYDALSHWLERLDLRDGKPRFDGDSLATIVEQRELRIELPERKKP